MLANVKITLTDERGVEDTLVFNVEGSQELDINTAVFDQLDTLIEQGCTSLNVKRTILRRD